MFSLIFAVFTLNFTSFLIDLFKMKKKYIFQLIACNTSKQTQKYKSKRYSSLHITFTLKLAIFSEHPVKYLRCLQQIWGSFLKRGVSFQLEWKKIVTRKKEKTGAGNVFESLIKVNLSHNWPSSLRPPENSFTNECEGN